MAGVGLTRSLVRQKETKIVFLILDGLGGLPLPGREGTELEVADTPNLDALAGSGVCGLLDPIGPGITPGSGPAHLALFGYDPVRWTMGRGGLAALGVGLDLSRGDVAVRINFCSLDEAGRITDRRAGRIGDDVNRRLVARLREEIDLGEGVEVILETVKEHRAVVVFRGEGLGGEVSDTDPQRTGVPPLEPQGADPASRRTAELARRFAEQAREILADEPRAQGVLLRGFAVYHPFPSMGERYGLEGLAIARYPDYRGVARLVGMTVLWDKFDDLSNQFDALARHWDRASFFFIHEKGTDARGEDGDFDAKVAVIESVDRLLPRLLALNPDVLVVTGDHSTPAAMKSHSWHPVPVLLTSRRTRPDGAPHFGERWCRQGGLGRLPMTAILRLSLAHAGRLAKYGA